MQNADSGGESVRKCPTCRSTISVMATRCKYCGEKVSRPRGEEEQFSIRDLGGESESNYKISASVMGALEAFREEVFDEYGHPTTAEPAGGIPGLDAKHQALVEAVRGDDEELAASSGRGASAKPKPRPQLQQDNTPVIIAASVFGLVLLVVGALWLNAKFGGQDQAPLPTYDNRALTMLESGQYATIEALEEANKAVAADNSLPNQEIRDKVRKVFVEEVEELLNCVPWEREKLHYASRITKQATTFDTSHVIDDLRSRVQEEVEVFRLLLKEIDGAAKKATFILYPSKEQQVVEVGDYVAERFIVQSITNQQVVLLDEQVPHAGSYRKLAVRELHPISGI